MLRTYWRRLLVLWCGLTLVSCYMTPSDSMGDDGARNNQDQSEDGLSGDEHAGEDTYIGGKNHPEAATESGEASSEEAVKDSLEEELGRSEGPSRAFYSTVKIVFQGFGVCSGSWISSRHIMTAAHCLLKDEQMEASSLDDLLAPAVSLALDTQRVVEVSAGDRFYVKAFDVDRPEDSSLGRTLSVDKAYISARYLDREDVDKDQLDVAVLELSESYAGQGLAVAYDLYSMSGGKVRVSGFPVLTNHKFFEAELDLVRPEDLQVPDMLEFAFYTGPVPGSPRDDSRQLQSFSGGPLYLETEQSLRIAGTVRTNLCEGFGGVNCILAARTSWQPIKSLLEAVVKQAGYELVEGANSQEFRFIESVSVSK